MLSRRAMIMAAGFFILIVAALAIAVRPGTKPPVAVSTTGTPSAGAAAAGTGSPQPRGTSTAGASATAQSSATQTGTARPGASPSATTQSGASQPSADAPTGASTAAAPPQSTPRAPITRVPSSPTPEAAAGAASNSPHINGLVPADAYGRYTSRGFQCAGPTTRVGLQVWLCTSRSADGQTAYSVEVIAVDAQRTYAVTGAVTQRGAASTAIASAFLGDLASLGYTGADPARARAWAEQNVSTGGELGIGTAAFALDSESAPRSIRLEITGTQSGR